MVVRTSSEARSEFLTLEGLIRTKRVESRSDDVILRGLADSQAV